MPVAAIGFKMFSLWENKNKNKQKICFWTCHTDKQVYMGYSCTQKFCTECLIGILQENQKFKYKPYNNFQMTEAVVSLRKPIINSLCYSNRCKISIMLCTTLEIIQRQLSRVIWGIGINCPLKEKGKSCSLYHNIRSSLEIASL